MLNSVKQILILVGRGPTLPQTDNSHPHWLLV